MGTICVSARIADMAINQALAAANLNQIRNVNPKLFDESGNPARGRNQA
jgi:hypothetical protein